MKKFFLILGIGLLVSCGQYEEIKVDLSDAQKTAIRNHLTQKCVQDNADLFNTLGTNTGDFAAAGTQTGSKYELTDSSESTKPEIVVLKKTSTAIYVYVSPLKASEPSYVYKYTTTNNEEHMEAIKSLACDSQNTFSGDANSFSYQANDYSPNQTDADRTEYKSSYNINGNLPIFFSLFNRTYKKNVYEDDAIKSSSSFSSNVSYKAVSTLSSADLDNYEDEFTASEHCVFETGASATWLDADYPTSLEDTLNSGACSPVGTPLFDWVTDIGDPH